MVRTVDLQLAEPGDGCLVVRQWFCATRQPLELIRHLSDVLILAVEMALPDKDDQG